MNIEDISDHSKANIKVVLVLTLVHFGGDFYASFVGPLLPVFMERLSISLTQVGLIAGLTRVLAFIVQPTVGYIADNYKNRVFILGGPLMAITFMPLVGLATSYWMLILFTCLGSIGSSMFHPTTAGMVSFYAGRHHGFSLAIFGLGGTLAFGVGPIFITSYVANFGLEKTPYTMLIGLTIMLFLFRTVPHPAGEGLAKFGFLGAIKEAMGAVWKIIIIIWIVMVLRTFVGQSFLTFIPVLCAQRGYPLVSIGAIISIFIVAGAISGLLAGLLADRIGYKPLFYASLLLTPPCLYLFLYLPGNWVYVGSFLSGFAIMATMPLGVAIAQELAPRGRSMASGLMMGLSFGIGGMMIPLTGRLADIYGIRTVLSCLALVPLLITCLVYFFPDKEEKGSA